MKGGNGLMARLDFFEAMSDAGIFTPTALRIALKLLYRHMNGATGRCDPAVGTLAAETGLDERRVRRALRELEADDWWIIDQSVGRGHTNSYRPNYEKGGRNVPLLDIEKGAETTPIKPDKRGSFCTEKGVETTPRTSKNQKEDYPPITPQGGRQIDSAGAFAELWRVYPNRSGRNPKAPAQAKFCQALKRGADPASIIRGAKNYARQIERDGTDRKYVAQLVTWLNQRSWEDYQELTEPAPPARKRVGIF